MRRLMVVSLGLLLGAVPVAADELSVQVDPRANLSAYRTFQLRDGKIDSPRPELDNPLFIKKLRTTIRAALIERGLTETSDQPDLVVEFEVAGEDFSLTEATTVRGAGPEVGPVHRGHTRRRSDAAEHHRRGLARYLPRRRADRVEAGSEAPGRRQEADREVPSRPSLDVNRDDFVQLDRRHADRQDASHVVVRGVVPAVSRCTFYGRNPSGIRTRTVSGPTGIVSRSGPFIIIGLVRLTRCTVIDVRCRQAVTSMQPGPVTSTGAGSFVVHATRLREQPSVIGRHHFPERPVDVPRHVGDAAARRARAGRARAMSVRGTRG